MDMSSSQRHEDVSIEQPPSGNDHQANVDFLMDENILTNESNDAADNESVIEGTPSGGNPVSKGIN